MRILTTVLLVCLTLTAISASGDNALQFADVLTDNVVLQRGKDITCWGTSAAGATVDVLLTQSREAVIDFAGEAALQRPDDENTPEQKVQLAYVTKGANAFKPVTVQTTADKDGRWEVNLSTHAATFTPTFLAAKSGDASIAIQNLLIGEVWIASGQSNMSWANSRDKMWEKRGLVLPGVRFTKVDGDSYTPRETLGQDSEPARWIVSDDGAVEGISAIGYVFGQYLHRQLKVPVGVIVISQGGSFSREWCSRKLLEQMGSPTVDQGIKDHDAKIAAGEKPADSRGPASLYNARLYPIRKMTVAGVIYMQGENESLCGDLPQYLKTLPGVIQSYREALGEPELPFGIITLQGYGGYTVAREIHYNTHLATPNTGYIVAHDIGGNIHPTWKRPLAQRTVYWALRDVYGVITKDKRLQVKDVRFEDGKANVLFEQVELKNGEWQDEGKLTMPWTNDQQAPSGFDIAGEDRAWYRARVMKGGSAEDGLILSHALVSKPVAIRYGWGGFPCGNLGSWDDPMPPYRSDNWPVVTPDIVATDNPGQQSASEQRYSEVNERKNQQLELGLKLAIAESREDLIKRYAHPKGMLQATVSNMQDLMQLFDGQSLDALAPQLARDALHSIPCRYWRRDRYSPARRAKWGWFIERVLRLEKLPSEMEKALAKRSLKKKITAVEESLADLQAEIDKLEAPEPMDFDTMLDKVLAVMAKETERLTREGVDMEKQRRALNPNPF